jgi:hypothetical protein
MDTPSIQSVQEFFFDAMVKGYARFGVHALEIAEMPEYKAVPFRIGDFSILDLWSVNPSSQKSAGTTTIWFQDLPVWVMSYGGLYTKNWMIVFLKRALLHAYEARQFIGGRGPLVYNENPLVYVNHPRLSYFARFEGHEEIFDTNGENSLGFHDYWGMSLL